MELPRIGITALRGGSGKTILSIGLIAALKRNGKNVAPFKKGPDYIDAGWLAMAAGRPCYNLDTFLIEEELVKKSFYFHSTGSDLAVIEGNRGIFDGIDLDGKTSTAEVSKILDVPLILCLDCTKSTRTIAATVLGCLNFDPDVKLAGVVLNRVAGGRHENIIKTTIEHHCGLPVLGAIPKIREQVFPERHMGLVPTPEHDWAVSSINEAANIAEKYVNIDKIVDVASKDFSDVTDRQSISDLTEIYRYSHSSVDTNRPVIGVIKDSSFQFYYPENIEALEACGAEVIYFSPLKDKKIPDIDGLYIGGGFPETHAGELSENSDFRNQLKSLAEGGMPVYAECGGLMYLGEKLVIEGKDYPMAGIFPITYGVSKKPQGHGYVVVKVDDENPYFEKGTIIKGHEFRYSKIIDWKEKEGVTSAFTMERGTGMADGRDGVCYKNVLATYTHLHALGTKSWAGAMVSKASEYKSKKQS